MYSIQLDHSPESMTTDGFIPIYKLDKVEAYLLLELLLIVHEDTITLYLKLVCDKLYIGNTPGCRFSTSVEQTDLKVCRYVEIHILHPISLLFFCSLDL